MIPQDLPFEYPFRWRNEDLAAGVGASPEIASILEQRDRDLEDFLAALGGGGGGGAPTIYVAASDASSYSKSLANYVCNGTDDDVEINAAQDELFELAVAGGYNSTDYAAPGGRVLLSEGTFHIDEGSIDDGLARHGYFNGPPNMTLQGMGKTATRIKQTGTDFAVISYGDGYCLSDLTIDAIGSPTGGQGVYMQSSHCTVERVRFRGVGLQNYGNLHIQDDAGRVQDCEFLDGQGDSSAIHLGDSAAHCFIIGNFFENVPLEAVYAPGPGYSVVANNIVKFSQSNGYGYTDAIHVGFESVVVGNICRNGDLGPATITAGAGSQVIGNVLV